MKIEKLYPECKDTLWGGEQLKEKYNKITDKEPVAESWELSFHRDGLTRLSNGKTLKETATPADLGANAEGFPFFPVLVKLIDAKQNLSVQVHPSDDYALQNENSFGKTETWYIVDADENASIYLGFKRDVTEEEFEKGVADGSITDLLNRYEVKKGESYFIPSGTLHAINSGCLICEIQQNSNLTYRVYDYNRKDKNGNERELHVDKALKVTDFKKYVSPKTDGERFAMSKYFTAFKINVDGVTLLTADKKSFKCVTLVDGSCEINGVRMLLGDSFFVPAGFGEFSLVGNCTVIVAEIRKYYIETETDGGAVTVTLVDDNGCVIAEKTGDSVSDLTAEILKEKGMTKNDISIW